jgi:hypothetical protein
LVSLALVLCIYMGYHVVNHLPIKDFRAYKVGMQHPKIDGSSRRRPKNRS